MFSETAYFWFQKGIDVKFERQDHFRYKKIGKKKKWRKPKGRQSKMRKKKKGKKISRREKNRVCYRASDDSVKRIFKIIFREKLK